MKRWLKVILMMIAGVFAQGGANANEHGAVIRLEANPTTGYIWTGFVLSGDSVELENEEGEYISKEGTAEAAGAGGETEFVLKPIKEGTALVRFTYARPWEKTAEQEVVIVATVDKNMEITTMDVSESGIIYGIVAEVDKEESQVLLHTKKHGEIMARFLSETELPVMDEKICVYTDGTMTMSLPAIVNVMAWNAVADDVYARHSLPQFLNMNVTEDLAMVTFCVDDAQVMEIGEKLEEIEPEAYMNGYNWEVLLNAYLEENQPELLEGMETDAEAGNFTALYLKGDQKEEKATELAEVISELIEHPEELQRWMEENASEIDWD